MNQRYVNGVDVVVRRNGVHKCCPQPMWERNKTCLTALAAIGSTVITQQIMTELSSGFNSIGFVASDQVKTMELSWSSSVLNLETTSGMFKVFQSYPGCMFFDWCLLQDDIWCDGLVTLVPIKQKSSNRKAQYGTSYPTHLTRLEEQIKTLPYPPYIGMALKLCTCRLFTRTTCSLLLPGLELNMTFPFRPYKVYTFPQWHRDFTSIKFNGLESGKPGCHRPHRTSSTLKMSPSCQGILHHLKPD